MRVWKDSSEGNVSTAQTWEECAGKDASAQKKRHGVLTVTGMERSIPGLADFSLS